jgi:hypothetical protein
VTVDGRTVRIIWQTIELAVALCDPADPHWLFDRLYEYASVIESEGITLQAAVAAAKAGVSADDLARERDR